MAKTIEVAQIENPCQQCGGPQVGKMHFDSDNNPELMSIRCLKCGAQKRLYAGRREPRYRRGFANAMGIKEMAKRKGWV